MIRSLRSGSKSIFAKAMLVVPLLLALAGLALMDGQGMVNTRASTDAVAKIGGEEISAQQLDAMVQTAIRNQGATQKEALAAGLPHMLLEREINSRLLRLAAEDMGIRINDALAAEEIKKLTDPIMEQGKMDRQQAFNYFLRSINMNEEQAVAAIKTQMSVMLMVATLTGAVAAPAPLVEDALQYRYEARGGIYFTLDRNDAGKVETPDDKTLQAYYETVSENFMTPETRDFSIVKIDAKALGIADPVITDEDIKSYYDTHLKDYYAPEKRDVVQVVAQSEENANAIHAKATALKSLKAAAEAFRKDKGNAAAALMSGTYTEEDMPVETGGIAFKAQKSEIAQPQKTALGWVIVEVGNIAPAITKTLDQVKADITKKLAAEKAAEALYEKANQIDDMIAGGRSLSEVAAEYKLATTLLSGVTADGKTLDGKDPAAAANLPMYQKLVENGFALQEGDTSQLIETDDGSFIILQTAKIIPTSAKPFAAVEDKIASQWKEKEINERLEKKAEDLLARLKKGEKIGQVAASAGKSPAKIDLIRRNETIKKDIKTDRVVLSSLFAIEKESDTVIARTATGPALVQMTQRMTTPPKNVTSEEKDSLSALLRDSMRNDLLAQYRDILFDKYDVAIYNDVIDKMYTQSDAE